MALATGSEVPGARVIGVDISPSAIQLARANARRLRLSNVRFLRGDLFGPLPGSLRGSVDVLSIHPPYVGTRELRNLPREIVAFEPRESLTDGSPLGDRIVTTVAEEAPGWLRQGGWLLVEVSPDVSRWVGTVLRRSGFREVRSTIGGARVGRVVVGRS